MKSLYSIVFTLFCMSAFAQTGGTFQELPGTKLSSLNPCPADNCVYSHRSGHKGLFFWSGGAYGDGNMYVSGGGHYGYDGNELYQLSLTQYQWSRLTEPSRYKATPEMRIACVYPDGQPVASHTYNSFQYSKPHKTLVKVGAYGASPDGNGNDCVFTYKIGAGPWVNKGKTGISGQIRATFSAVLPSGDILYHKEGGGIIAKYSVQDNKHAELMQESMGKYTVAATDTRRKKVFAVGGKLTSNRAFLFDVSDESNITMTNIKNLVPVQMRIKGQMGLDYDSKYDRYVAWNGGRTVYIIHPETFEVTTLTATGDNPGEPNETGTYGRFRYMSEFDQFVLVNRINQNVFLLQLHGGDNPMPDPVPDPEPVPTPDPDPVDPPATGTSSWAERSTAPGVIRAIGFDVESDVTRWTHLNDKADRVSWQDGALRFDILKDDGADSGNWRTWLADDEREFVEGDEFYVSFRQYFPEYFASNRFSGGGWKQAIISRNGSPMDGVRQDCQGGDACGSNQLNEFVLNNQNYRGILQGYHRDTAKRYPGLYVKTVTPCSRTDYVYQNAVDRGPKSVGNDCENYRAQHGGTYSYKGPYPNPDTGAWKYPYDQWATFKVWIKLGSQGTSTANSQIKVWAAHDGEDWDLLIDRDDIDLGDGPAHNAIWLLPYDTEKAGGASQDTFTLYDELIVSLNDIAAPDGSQGPPAEPPVDPDPEPPIDPPDCPMPVICPPVVAPEMDQLKKELESLRNQLDTVIENL